MSFYVYILYSKTIDEYYVGHSGHLENRLFHHLHSGSKATKKTSDWILVYKEEFNTKAEACRREMQIKKKKSHRNIAPIKTTNTKSVPQRGGKKESSTPIFSTRLAQVGCLCPFMFIFCIQRQFMNIMLRTVVIYKIVPYATFFRAVKQPKKQAIGY